MTTHFPEERLRERITNLLNVCYSSADVSTKQEFAKLIGTNYLQLYRWMEGKTIPRKEALKRICDVCDVDFLTFMALEDYEKNPHKKLNLAFLDLAYAKAEQDGNREDSESIISLACALTYDLLQHLDINMTITAVGQKDDILPRTRGQINFGDTRLVDFRGTDVRWQ